MTMILKSRFLKREMDANWNVWALRYRLSLRVDLLEAYNIVKDVKRRHYIAGQLSRNNIILLNGPREGRTRNFRIIISTYLRGVDDRQMIFSLLIRCLSKASEKRQEKYLLPCEEIKVINLARNNCARYVLIFFIWWIEIFCHFDFTREFKYITVTILFCK